MEKLLSINDVNWKNRPLQIDNNFYYSLGYSKEISHLFSLGLKEACCRKKKIHG